MQHTNAKHQMVLETSAKSTSLACSKEKISAANEAVFDPNTSPWCAPTASVSQHQQDHITALSNSQLQPQKKKARLTQPVIVVSSGHSQVQPASPVSASASNPSSHRPNGSSASESPVKKLPDGTLASVAAVSASSHRLQSAGIRSLCVATRGFRLF